MNFAALIDEKTSPQQRAAPMLAADSLALGMAFLLGLTAMQRLVGLLRNILFCRYLDEEQLGLWSLGFSFLVLAAPLAVLGLPGSFGRYVEYFRQRGQLGGFLWRTTCVTVFLAAAAMAVVCLGREWFARFIYSESSQAPLMLALGVGLATTIALNFLVELLTALRQTRVVSLMQFAYSVAFTIIGLGLLCGTSLGTVGLAGAHAAASLLACLGALPVLARLKVGKADRGASPVGRDVWGKLLPYAAWVWAINVLANLADIADRYLIMHWSGLDPHVALGWVGQLHASRVIPALMVGVAVMVGGAILPHLSHDWEAGRRERVSARLNLALKLLGLSFTAGSVLVLVLSPVLFGWLLQGRYNGGLAVLSLSLTYCVWFSLGLVAQNFLLCAEQNKLGGLAFATALACNVVLNLALLPFLGLHGVALATALANGVLLAVMLVLCRRAGMSVDFGTVLVCLAPPLLLLGALPAAVAFVLVAWFALWGTWFFSDQEKQQLLGLIMSVMRRQKHSDETASGLERG
jgi:PST family polysaccharide transporter